MKAKLKSAILGFFAIGLFICPIALFARTLPPGLAGIIIAGMSSFSALSSAFGFQILSLRREVRRGASLDNHRREILRRRLERSVRSFFKRWALSFTFGLGGAAFGLAIREMKEPNWSATTGGLALCFASIFFLFLMVLEYRALLQLATDLEDRAEEIKRARERAEKLKKIK